MVIRNTIPLELRYIGGEKGFGVFSCEEIPEQVVVETCYCIKTYNRPINPAFDYLFSLDNKEILLPFGYGPIYNHSYTPNIHWRMLEGSDTIIEFYSLCQIPAGEELCHNYGELYWKSRAFQDKKLI